MHSLTEISSKIGRLHTAYVTIVNLKDMIPTYLYLTNIFFYTIKNTLRQIFGFLLLHYYVLNTPYTKVLLLKPRIVMPKKNHMLA